MQIQSRVMLPIVLSAMIALFGSPFVYFKWQVACHASNYEPTTLVVERVEYRLLCSGRIRTPVAYGTIRGATESLPLSRNGPTSESRVELERLYPRGTKITVLHDPSAPPTLLNGFNARSLPIAYDLSNPKRAVVFTMLVTYGPLLAALAFHFHLTRKEKRLDQQLREQSEAKAARKRAWREANGPRRSYFLKRKKRR